MMYRRFRSDRSLPSRKYKSIATRSPLLALVWVSMLLCSVSLFYRVSAAETVHFYVAPIGNDNWSGASDAPTASDGPFATPERARDAVRDLLGTNPDLAPPVVVQFRGGNYFLKAPLTFGPADSGTATSLISYEAYPGEFPILSAGLPVTNWQQTPAGTWQAQVADETGSPWVFSQLYVNDQRRFRPSLPRNGYFYMGEAVNLAPGAQPSSFHFLDNDIRADWQGLSEIEVVAFHNWSVSRIPIKSVDLNEQVVTLWGSTFGVQWAPLGPDTWYRLENVAEAPWQPGDWYLDRASGSLEYVPLPGEDLQTAHVVAARHSSVMRLAGDQATGRYVHHLRFHGLTFAHNNWNVPLAGHSYAQSEADLDGAVSVRYAQNITIENCVVRHTGTYGINLGAGCSNCRVETSELFDLGAGGVKIGAPDTQGTAALWSSNCVVRDCVIAHGGRTHPAGMGVWIGFASSNVIDHNDIFDFYQTGISAGWTWNTNSSPAHDQVITWNHIHDIGQRVTSDLGGIYTLGDNTGSVERFNFVDNISRARYGGWGIYFDEGTSHLVAENNLVYHCEDAAFDLNWGQDNLVHNNIFALGTNSMIQLSDLTRSGALRVEQNIFYWREGPLFQGSPDSEITFWSNLYWQAGSSQPITFADGATLAMWRQREPGVVVADPLFENLDAGDFRLAPGSPAFTTGFQSFDLSTAGRLTTTSRTANLPLPPSSFPPAPDPPPIEVHEDFESFADGGTDPGFSYVIAAPDQGINVTTETAATGTHSLKFSDGPDGEAWEPHAYRNLRSTSGIWRLACDLKVTTNAWVVFEGRDTDPWYTTGPQLEVRPGGLLFSAGKNLTQVPVNQWFNAELICGVGAQATGKFKLVIRRSWASPVQTFENLSLNSGFKTLDWLGFSSVSRERCVYYVDNLVVEPVGKQPRVVARMNAGSLNLIWPLGSPAAKLFRRGDLDQGNSWTLETTPPAPFAGRLHLSLPMTASHQYFQVQEQ